MTTNEAITPCIQPDTDQPIIIQVVGNGDTGSVGDALRYNICIAAILGSLHICFGVLSIALSAIVIQSHNWVHKIAFGFWLPLLWFIAGGFGLGTAYKWSKGLITTFMVMSIISACSMIVYIAFVGIDIFLFIVVEGLSSRESELTDEEYSEQVTLKSVIGGIGVCEVVNSILSATFGCSIVCCGASKTMINAQTLAEIQQIVNQASTSQGATAQPLGTTGLEDIELQVLAPSSPD